MKNILIAFLSCFLFITMLNSQSNDYYLLVGTYTTSPSDGIEVFGYNSGNGQFHFMHRTPLQNPSYLAVSPDHKFLYSVAENGQPNGGSVYSFKLDTHQGSLEKINSQPSMGNHPCYVSVFKTGKYVAAGNYSSGNLVYYSVNADGSLNAPLNIVHKGSGGIKGRQDSPHVHAAVYTPDNKYLLVPDLGADRVVIYALKTDGMIDQNKTSALQLPPASGPRHIEFHPSGKWAYLMEEISGKMTALSYSNGKLKIINSVMCYPDGYSGALASADVHVSPDGKYVYGSNRIQHNSIGIFKIDPVNGKVSKIANQDAKGEIPRNFTFDPTGNLLLVANQNSGEVVLFKVDKSTGLLTDTGNRLSINKPVCLKWVKKDS